jgi:hypothetical protein
MKTFALCILAYVLVAHFAFGNVFAAFTFVLLWSHRLGAPLWPALVGASALISGVVFLPRVRAIIGQPYRLAFWIASTMLLSLLFVGLYADRLRNQAVITFKPDAYFQHSFFRSIKESPKDFQFFLHAGVLKNCVPYAWSYRDMAFDRLPGSAAVNVLPRQWITTCGIKPEY